MASVSESSVSKHGSTPMESVSASFPKFTSLPPELQLLIWSHALRLCFFAHPTHRPKVPFYIRLHARHWLSLMLACKASHSVASHSLALSSAPGAQERYLRNEERSFGKEYLDEYIETTEPELILSVAEGERMGTVGDPGAGCFERGTIWRFR